MVDPCRRTFAPFLLALLFVATADAGDWHYGSSLVCSDCHTQHNSSGGQPMRTDDDPNAAPLLLRRATPTELCLSCHDGANAAAPDVIAPVTYVADAAGGSFANSGGSSMPNGHDLNNATPEVPPGGSQAVILLCTTCHDPHGNPNYRNLRPDPLRAGAPGAAVVASQGTVANGSNPASVYVPANIIYKSGVSAWCGTCHSGPIPGTDHPVDRTIWGAAGADYETAWLVTTLPRVPVHSPADDVIPSVDDQVICLSCHKAHGSSNDNGFVYADGATLDSTCQECHNK